ncbi:MAG: prepilin-type N-terminal cleavage/methylation domain-containing protein [bacterium]|nr:prepilin-type N-terminal cleavage/methylation domain-containing protein [bacterium]
MKPTSRMRGFSLIEVVAVMALLLLIMGLGLWGLGGSRGRQLREKVVLDLARIDSAKATWRADHPQAAFPDDEAARFDALPVLSGRKVPPCLFAAEHESGRNGCVRDQCGDECGQRSKSLFLTTV